MCDVYSDALSKGLLFFEAQRSGKLPADNRIPWRGDSCLSDGSDVGLDLSRAYFDSGDHVVFGLPLSFTLSMMAFGLVEYGDLYGTEQDRAVAALKWGTDWLLRAHHSENELYVQVGDGEKDHACWTRPEDLDMERSTELQAAFYKSYSGYGDELLWAAAWLHRATSDPTYIAYMTGPNSNDGPLNWKGTASEISWDDKRAAAQLLAARLVLLGQQPSGTALDHYKKALDGFVCSYVTGNTPETAAGLPWIREWLPLQYVTTSAFVIAVYGDLLRQANASLTCSGSTYTSDMLLAYSKKQADYILGANPRGISYMVGLGESFPQRVHHRAASIPKDGVHYKCGEGFKFFQTSDPNPNVLEGAIVGGPDQADNFQDARTNFKQSEASTYTNAPFLGLVARLSSSRALPLATPVPTSAGQPAPAATPAATTPDVAPGPVACDCDCEGF
ncbi:endo-1,4-beta-glucanase [Klebsormidium nitens]|uniref:Endoglucanase n=1 Tax=Klebsormidium nitens TaxID=105231 RepID=A0A1Y1II63_KLENI|nr:endo-1,4-beta-glucanase [Klebsormidium nitens]|eukprot:GAQ90575.1 endo-1,4-beta-glucanase [Klebsormidium nitens]